MIRKNTKTFSIVKMKNKKLGYFQKNQKKDNNLLPIIKKIVTLRKKSRKVYEYLVLISTSKVYNYSKKLCYSIICVYTITAYL